MSFTDDTAAAMIGKIYPEAVAAAAKEAHRRILDAAETMRMKSGASFEVVGDGGEAYGTVRYNAGRLTPKVVDPAALLAWVQERYPTEVRDVPTIQEKFLEKLLKEAADGVLPDGVPPGVNISEGDPFLTITPTADARTRAREMVEGQGRPSLPGLTSGTE